MNKEVRRVSEDNIYGHWTTEMSMGICYCRCKAIQSIKNYFNAVHLPRRIGMILMMIIITIIMIITPPLPIILVPIAREGLDGTNYG